MVPGEEIDDDGDLQSECQGDCDDADTDRFLGNPELCDAIDNDCDLVVPTDELDDDGDGQAECEGDCDDADANMFDGNPEVCDGFDNDCDGVLGTPPEAHGEQGNDGSYNCGSGCNVGNVYEMTTDSVLTGLEIYLGDADQNSTSHLIVYSRAQSGDAWDLEYSEPLNPGVARAWIGSTSLNISLTSGMQYLFGWSMDNSILNGLDSGGPGSDPAWGTWEGLQNSNGNEGGLLLDPLGDNFFGSNAYGIQVTVGTGDEADDDADGFMVCEDDCDDDVFAVNPGAEEICDDGIDNDCDGTDETNCSFWCKTNSNDEMYRLGFDGTLLETQSITWADNASASGNALAMDPTTGIAYAALKYTGRDRFLVTLDMDTFVATTIDALPNGTASLAFDDAGLLYALTGDGGDTAETLWSIDKATAAATSLLTLGNGDDGESLSFDPATGMLIHTSGLGTNIESIDPVSLAVTDFHADEGPGEISGNVIDPATGLLVVIDLDFNMYSFDLATGVSTQLGTDVPTIPCRGAMLVVNDAPPEPS